MAKMAIEKTINFPIEMRDPNVSRIGVNLIVLKFLITIK